MTLASEWLAEITAHTGSGLTVLRFSTGGYVTGPDDSPANTVYPARIGRVGTFAQHLFGDGRTIGEASVELSDMVLANADGVLDHLLDFGFDGRPFVLKRVVPGAAYSTAATVLTGTVEGVDASNGSLDLVVRFYDRRRDIDVPIQVNKYGGTTITSGASADGSAEMKGQLKPLCYGKCFSVPAVIANPFSVVLQFNDGAVSAIALMDGGIALTNDGDVATLALLVAATGNPGHYKTCLALGLARPFGTVNGRPAFVWTADVTVGTLADRYPGAIARAMLDRIGLTGTANILASTFTALDADAPIELGIYIATEKSALSAIREILGSVGGYAISNAGGQFTVGRITVPGASVGTITDPEILTSSSDETLSYTTNPDTDGSVPAHQIDLSYRRNWHVHSTSDLGGCVTFHDPLRAGVLQQEMQSVSTAPSTVKTKHLLSQPLAVDTLIVNAVDAQAEAARRLVLYGVNRYAVRVGVEFPAPEMQPGATATLQTDRFGFANGRAMRIIGRSNDNDAEKAILTLWG